jgi:hypothetical protein
VRLYLSSFRMGDHPEHLAALVGEGGRHAVVIANAMDDAPAGVRRSGVERELAALTDLGFDAVELDLRDYFGQERRLRRDLAGVALAWLRGGNVFMLRFALFRSAGTLCSVICLPQTRWSTPGTAQERVSCHRRCVALRSSTTLARSRGSTAQSQCGMAWRCSKRRSSRTTSHRGIPRQPR